MDGTQVITSTRTPPDTATVEESIRELFASSLRDEAAIWERDAAMPKSAFERMADTGVFAARWPRDAREPGNVAIGSLLVRETALVSVGGCIAVGTHLEVFFRALARSEYGADRWSEALAGRLLGGFAVSEYGGGSNPSNCETTAEPSGDGWVLNGHKHYVSNAGAATDLIVFARTSRGRDLNNFTVFLVPTDATVVTITPHDLLGARASGTCSVDLREVEVCDERRVGRVGGGLALLFDFLRGERMAAASGSLAAAELCFEIALAWASARQSAGEPLRQRQTIAHRLAILSSEIAAARGLLADRIQRAQAGRITSAEAAQAKYIIGRLAWRAADEAMQILAGHGYTEETPFAQLWRDIRIGRIGGGTDEVQLEIVAQNLRPGTLATHPLVRTVEQKATCDAC
jgi:alkylation response protein AidB-like acyl-CoA dehydrogenase